MKIYVTPHQNADNINPHDTSEVPDHELVDDIGSHTPSIDVGRYNSRFSMRNKLRRFVWNITWLLLFRLSPRPLFAWRRLLLRCFGAEVGRYANIYPTTKIWGPWNLKLKEYACLGPDVDCYCMDTIYIGAHATISQYSYLCTGTHDIADPNMKLLTAPITIGAGAWVCADAFIGPGVTISEGAVVGARASVFKDVEPWTVVGGNPAKFIKKRILDASKRSNLD